MTRSFDVVVIGGGPGGSVCAAQLAAKGLGVGVFEKEHFPRFHLGESLLPQSLPVLAEIGVLPELFEHFVVKHGARFHDDVRGRDRFAFRDAWAASRHAFEVPRTVRSMLCAAAKRGPRSRAGGGHAHPARGTRRRRRDALSGGVTRRCERPSSSTRRDVTR